jgi:hypothetical protein
MGGCRAGWCGTKKKSGHVDAAMASRRDALLVMGVGRKAGAELKKETGYLRMFIPSGWAARPVAN